MHILFVADGRSPITRQWLKTLQPLGWQLSLISTFPCAPIDRVTLVAVLPVAFARHAGSQAGNATPAGEHKGLASRTCASRMRPLAQKLRHALGPWTLLLYTRRYRQLVTDLRPDLVHALRIPFEGMLASATPAGIPLIVSTWGNDLTLHAPASLRMSALTRQTLRRADALMSDTRRDARLVQAWGFDPAKPVLVVPGNSGLDLVAMKKTTAGIARADPPQIIDPRGLRSYVRTDIFFQAIPLVLAKYPDVRFVCTSMQGQKEALDWVQKLGIASNVTLLPLLSQEQLWQEFARSTISVSLSIHDGTPNTLLEAMALGCLPICGDVESIREWITPGKNGLLVDPADAQALAGTILHGLENVRLQKAAAVTNQKLVTEKAGLETTRTQIVDFYRRCE
jgi:glycosyltransferase involved in cell wall biosynthesis